jgi:hypothetical protein
MIGRIENPLAEAMVYWIPEEEGGRVSPPPGPVYAATVAFADAEEGAPQEEWRLGEHDLSILLELVGPVTARTQRAHVGFVASALAAPRVSAHDHFVVFEGRRRVALGTITGRRADAAESCAD